MDVGPMMSAMQDLESREACQQCLKATGMDDVVLSDSYDIQAEAILCAIYLLYGLDDTERIWRMFVSAVASVDDAAPSGSSTSALRSGKQERQQTVTTRSMESVAAWQGAELGVPDSDVSRHHRRGDQLLHPALPPRLDRPLPFLTAPTATPPPTRSTADQVSRGCWARCSGYALASQRGDQIEAIRAEQLPPRRASTRT